MCKCGCNTCGTNNGPLLTEGKVKSLLSEGLQYHIDKKVPLFETVYRIGSDKHLALIKEARKMYSRNIIDLCEEDEALIGTHLGEFALYEGVSIPLDLPMLNEEVDDFYLQNAKEKLSNALEILGKETGKTRRGDKYLDITYIPKTSPQTQRPESVRIFYDNNSDLKGLDLPMLNEINKISSDKLSKLIPNLPKGYVGKNAGIGKYTISTPEGGDIVLTNSKDKKNWFYEPSNVALKILNEIDEDDEYEIASRKLFDMTWDEVRRQNNQDMVQDVHDEVSKDDSDGIYFNENTEEQYPNFDLNKNIRYQDTSISSGMWRYTGKEQGGKGVYRNLNNGQILGFDRSDFNIFRNNLSSHFDISESLNEDRKYNQEELLRLDLIARRRFDCDYKKCTDEQKAEVLKDKIKVGVKEALQESKKDLDEAEFKGKKVALGKPKRGGPKAYYVYVKDGDKVKKVTFGSGGLRAKIKNKEARNAFAARHNCKDKKDRTKAGYWSCNLPRYAPALGLGAKMNTFW